MSTKALARATRTDNPGLSLDRHAAALVGEIERYLAARSRSTAQPTAHHLVTKTTAALVAEALATLPAAPAVSAPELLAPSPLLRLLPDWALPVVRRLHAGRSRRVTAAEHLELTALVLETWGWAHNGKARTLDGRRCIMGAQAVLFRLGYGDESTVHAAAGHLQDVLGQRGISQAYYWWNEGPGRTREEALVLVRTAASQARGASR
ncbi:hypothetical protein AB0M94_38905 [Streptomyces xanthochromogenes]|uniref:DUF6197 family protein n=1 Tax=Streptomyces xanthochromogenes TaxID=67384 RepID=UPI0034496D08